MVAVEDPVSCSAACSVPLWMRLVPQAALHCLGEDVSWASSAKSSPPARNPPASQCCSPRGALVPGYPDCSKLLPHSRPQPCLPVMFRCPTDDLHRAPQHRTPAGRPRTLAGRLPAPWAEGRRQVLQRCRGDRAGHAGAAPVCHCQQPLRRQVLMAVRFRNMQPPAVIHLAAVTVGCGLQRPSALPLALQCNEDSHAWGRHLACACVQSQTSSPVSC